MSEDDILLRLASYILYRAGVFRIERNSDNTPYYYYYPAKEIGSKGKHTITSQLERLIEQYVDPVFKDLEKVPDRNRDCYRKHHVQGTAQVLPEARYGKDE